jgi:hypothetical protein
MAVGKSELGIQSTLTSIAQLRLELKKLFVPINNGSQPFLSRVLFSSILKKLGPT